MVAKWRGADASNWLNVEILFVYVDFMPVCFVFCLVVVNLCGQIIILCAVPGSEICLTATFRTELVICAQECGWRHFFY